MPSIPTSLPIVEQQGTPWLYCQDLGDGSFVFPAGTQVSDIGGPLPATLTIHVHLSTHCFYWLVPQTHISS